MTRPTLERLVQIHHAIASGAGPTLVDLAGLCDVHPRTIKRDLRQLREGFDAPLCCSRQDRRYRYERPFALLPEPFHERELLALSLVIDIAHTFRNTPFADALRRALEKLRAMLPAPGQLAYDDHSAAVAYVPDPAPPEQVQVAIHFSRLLEAANARRQVRLTYHSLSARAVTVRTVDPHQLYLHHGVWYLHGFCHLRGRSRDFAVHRVRSLELLATTFSPPDPEVVRQAMARRFTIIEETPADVAIRFDAETAPFVKERLWHATQRITDRADGSCVLRMQVEGLTSVLRWVLSFGRHAVPLAPPELVERARAEVRAMARAWGAEKRLRRDGQD